MLAIVALLKFAILIRIVVIVLSPVLWLLRNEQTSGTTTTAGVGLIISTIPRYKALGI